MKHKTIVLKVLSKGVTKQLASKLASEDWNEKLTPYYKKYCEEFDAGLHGKVFLATFTKVY